jgi:hypothetical protein
MEKTILIHLNEYLKYKEFHDKIKYEDAQIIDMSRFYSTSLVHHQQYLYISKDDFAKKYQKEFYELQNENEKLRSKIEKLKNRNLFERIINKTKWKN